MTLGKYIENLAKKLSRTHKYETKLAQKNMRKARANAPMPLQVKCLRSKYKSVQHMRYGFSLYSTRRKRGIKTPKGELLPRIFI